MDIEYFKNNLKDVQEMKNKINKMSNNTDKKEYEYKKTLGITLSDLSNYYMSQIPNCSKIKILEKAIIRKGEIVKLKTNIDMYNSNLDNFEIIFDGYVPMDGSLIMYSSKDEQGNFCIYVKNIIPDDKVDKFSQYKFCDNDILVTRLSGNIEIKCGSTVGILIPKTKEYTKEYQKEK